MTTPIDPVPAAPGTWPIIFYVPHQDDEVLWMWLVIIHHVLAGRWVIIVLCSDGSSSAMRLTLRGEESNGYWPPGWHWPEREGIPDLTPDDFARARDREFVAACLAMGVRREDIHLERGTRSSTLDVPQAKERIRRYADQYPNAGHYTMWWGDTDPTHKALGTALQQLATDPDPAQRLADCRWIVRRSQGPTAPGATQYSVSADIRARALAMARIAVMEYRNWSPDMEPDPELNRGRYAVGPHGVPLDFQAVDRGDPVWIVKTAT